MFSTTIFTYTLALTAALAPQLGYAVPVTEDLAPREPQNSPSIAIPQIAKYLNRAPVSTASTSGTASGCPTTGGNTVNQQQNLCSTGTSYCCVSDSKGNTCIDASVRCDHTVVCCNNANGAQICMGDMNFNMPMNINMPININVNTPTKKGSITRRWVSGLLSRADESPATEPLSKHDALIKDLLETTV